MKDVSDRTLKLARVACVVAIVVSFIFFGYKSKINQTKKRITQSPAPTVQPQLSEPTTPGELRLRDAFDVKRERYISARVTKISELSYRVDFYVNTWGSSDVLKMGDEGEIINDRVFFTHTISDLAQETEYKGLITQLFSRDPSLHLNPPEIEGKVAAVSPKGDRIAVYSARNIYIFSAVRKTQFTDGYKYGILEVKRLKTITIEGKGNSLSSFFFSGDGSELYFTTYDGGSFPSSYVSFKDDLNSKTALAVQLEVNPLGPLSNSKGYLSLNSQSWDDTRLVLNFPNHKKEIKIRSDDSQWNFLLSPDNSKVCFQGQYSGTIAYYIYDIAKQALIDDGKQYSYCHRWLDNNMILVSKDPYDGGGNMLFILDIRTKKFTLIEAWSEMVE